MNRWLETDTQKTARNIINVLNESAAGMVKKEINKDKPEEAPKNKKVALEKRITRAAIKGKKPESKNAKMPKKIAKKVVKEELEPETKKSIEDQIADLQDYLNNTPEIAEDEKEAIQAEIDDLISQLGEKEVDNKIMNEEQSNETDIIARLKSGDDVYFRNEEGVALLGHYADNYPEPEEYDEGFKPEYGGSEEALAAAKEAAKDGEVWEFITADDAGQSLGEVYTFCYGEKELADFLTQLREVKKVTRLEESAITEGIEEISRDLCANKDTFKYQMLSRLQNDCDYFLKAGNRSPSVLWAKNVDDHIKLMRDLYNSFAEEDKPEWITLDKIEEYEKEMKDNTLEEEFFNLYSDFDSLYGISKYSPKELKEFINSLVDLHRISEKDAKIMLDFADKYQKLIDETGYESTVHLKESYSDKLGGDPSDFVTDVETIKAKLSEIDTSGFGSRLAVQMVEDFIDTCDRQIKKAKRLASGDEFYTEADEAEYYRNKLKEEPLDLVAYEPEITSIDEVKDKYVKIRGDFHRVIDVKPEGDKFVISFAAGTGTAIGGEFEPATLDEIKRLQLYTENK